MKGIKKKILISCDSPRSLLDFRGKLIERLLNNYEVSIFTPRIEQLEIRDQLISMGVYIYENNLNPSNVSIVSDLRYIIDLYRLIKSVNPHVFFPYTFKPVIYGVLVAKYCKVKCITPMLTGLGYNFSALDKKKSLVQQITKLLLKQSLKATNRLQLILQNKDDYHTLIKEGIINAENKVHVVNGSGVDLSYYDYSLPDIKIISFLMISRLINSKGIREYYESAKLLKSKFNNVCFKLVGPYENNIDAIDDELYQKIRSDGVLQYRGLVSDIRPLISESSIIVLPSYYGEGIPRCVLEGMAMGRAVITSNSVGCKETINPLAAEINGFLVPVKDVPELTAKMEYCINHPEEVIRFGLNGRKYAKEKFDVNKVNEHMAQIIGGTA